MREQIAERIKETRKVEQEKVSQLGRKENLATPSIYGMLGGKETGATETQTTRVSEPIRTSEIDPIKLVEKWKQFADQVDAAQLKSALSVREPLLTEQYLIRYTLDNEVQRNRLILEVKPGLLAFLQRELHNDKIDLEFEIDDSQEVVVRRPYTDKERYDVLVNKYPLLGTLKSKFGLDFD
ncbi:MAG: hypothetical protein LWW85_11685 [Marinilabiliales bacterium]|nr:hypothetical protein [Marinilabiliales bacterium]